MKRTRVWLPALLSLATVTVVGSYDPTEIYERSVIAGFTVLVHPEVRRHPDDWVAALKEIEQQLWQIVRVVPDDKLTELRKVRIWVEWQKRKNGAAEFHVSAAWLRQNGYNPEKAGDVEICNVRNFVAWSRQDQPWMLMHEFAHAYHHRVLGTENPLVLSAYQKARERGLYEQVPYIRGGRRRAYALTNATEYFAELTEAYFGRNDFFPFNRQQLREYDPDGYALMAQVWGAPKDESSGELTASSCADKP